MIIGLQITAILFALIMIYFAGLHYKRKEISPLEMASWSLIWGLTMLITIFPELLRTYAQTFAVSRLFDLMVVGGFILTIAMVTSTYIRMKRIEKKVEDFIRKEAIRKFRKIGRKKR